MRPTIEQRSEYVAEQLCKKLNELSREAVQDNWDGRELVTGVAAAFKWICEGVGLSVENAIALVGGLKSRPIGSMSRIVAPNGRPLMMPPKVPE